MAGMLVLVWGTYCCLRVMYPAHARDWLWKRKSLNNNNNNKYNKNTYLEGCTRQDCLVLTYFSQELALSIFIAAPPLYFLGYFPLAFLEGHCPILSLVATLLHLDPVIWDFSAPSNRAASFSSTSSQSYWRYSNIFFFFSSSSAALYLSAFS